MGKLRWMLAPSLSKAVIGMSALSEIASPCSLLPRSIVWPRGGDVDRLGILDMPSNVLEAAILGG